MICDLSMTTKETEEHDSTAGDRLEVWKLYFTDKN